MPPSSPKNGRRSPKTRGVVFGPAQSVDQGDTMPSQPFYCLGPIPSSPRRLVLANACKSPALTGLRGTRCRTSIFLLSSLQKKTDAHVHVHEQYISAAPPVPLMGCAPVPVHTPSAVGDGRLQDLERVVLQMVPDLLREKHTLNHFMQKGTCMVYAHLYAYV
jgi:hypothetical protein